MNFEVGLAVSSPPGHGAVNDQNFPRRADSRSATGPRSQHPRRHAGARLDPLVTEQSRPLRAETSRAPERDRSPGRSALDMHHCIGSVDLRRNVSTRYAPEPRALRFAFGCAGLREAKGLSDLSFGVCITIGQIIRTLGSFS